LTDTELHKIVEEMRDNPEVTNNSANSKMAGPRAATKAVDD
jgi:hypothetical protein